MQYWSQPIRMKLPQCKVGVCWKWFPRNSGYLQNIKFIALFVVFSSIVSKMTVGASKPKKEPGTRDDCIPNSLTQTTILHDGDPSLEQLTETIFILSCPASQNINLRSVIPSLSSKFKDKTRLPSLINLLVKLHPFLLFHINIHGNIRPRKIIGKEWSWRMR